jgi:hypothetical protein
VRLEQPIATSFVATSSAVIAFTFKEDVVIFNLDAMPSIRQL